MPGPIYNAPDGNQVPGNPSPWEMLLTSPTKNGFDGIGYNEIKRKKRRKKNGSANGTNGSPGGSGSLAAGAGGSGSLGGGGGGGMAYNGFGRPPGYNRKYARRLVNADIQNQIRELLLSARGQKNQMNFDINKLNSNLSKQTGDLNYLFNEAGDFIGQQNKNIASTLAGAGQANNALFNNFQAQNETDVNARRNAAMAEMQRLGIAQAGMGQFDADAANANAQAGINNANANANLGAMQSGLGAVGGLLGSMSEASRASSIGRATNQHGADVAETRHAFNQYMTDVLGQIRNVKKNRFSQVNSLMQELQERQFNQWMALNQANFDNQLASNNFNLDMGQFNAGNFWNKAQLQQQASQAQAQVKYNQQLLNQQGGGQNSIAALMAALNPFG